jgi:hypothetical protein
LIIVEATPIKAGLYGSYAALLVALLRKIIRGMISKGSFKMLSEGGTGAIGVVSACACAGLITEC